MPTKREREYYRMGFADGQRTGEQGFGYDYESEEEIKFIRPRKTKRKLSDWQKYIKNKRNHIKYRDGKLNLKKMGVAFRRKQRR
jgi:hypothetical protein